MLYAHGLIHIFADTLIDKGLRVFMQWFELFIVAICRVFRLVEGRHIDAINSQQAFEETSAPASAPCLLPFNKGLGHLDNHFFTFADDKEVKEVGNRLYVVDAGAAAHDKGHIFATVFAPKGNPG